MILSAVIHLLPLEIGALPAYQGRAVDALFRSWVREVDEDLWAALHPQGEKWLNHSPAGSPAAVGQPYTISNLKGIALQGEQILLDPGQRLWWRVTSLDPALSYFVLDLLKKKVGDRCTIGEKAFLVQQLAFHAGQHEWAACTTYDDLLRLCLTSPHDPPDKFRLVFDSPVYFDDEKKATPFPLPELVVKQWRKKWNARRWWLQSWPSRGRWLENAQGGEQFVPVDEEIEQFVTAALGASRYDLQTVEQKYFRTPFIGFTGTCSYRVLSPHPVWSRWLHTLATFALFCGTGGKTSFGFGQTRMIRSHP